MSQADGKAVDVLIEAVREAERCDREAAQAIGRRERALDDLRTVLGYGDRLSAIRNGHLRIGELMTRERRS